jgi:DNA-3-methyladenine glycosylase I
MKTPQEHQERCPWHKNNQLAIEYHDFEWGIPVHDDAKHFEFLVLDAFQAGLSWNTILNKRENFRKAFDYKKIANYGEDKILELMNDAGIIRNKLKIQATISNAKAFMELQNEFGSFDSFIWNYVNHQTIINQYEKLSDIPPKTKLSDEISKDLINRGFKFVGSTIIYSYLQAAGLVNDHITTCFRYKELSA